MPPKTPEFGPSPEEQEHKKIVAALISAKDKDVTSLNIEFETRDEEIKQVDKLKATIKGHDVQIVQTVDMLETTAHHEVMVDGHLIIISPKEAEQLFEKLELVNKRRKKLN